MPPDSSSDFDIQLGNTVRELDDLYDDMEYDVFFIFHWNNLPGQDQGEEEQVSLHKIRDDLCAKYIKW